MFKLSVGKQEPTKSTVQYQFSVHASNIWRRMKCSFRRARHLCKTLKGWGVHVYGGLLALLELKDACVYYKKI